MLVRENVYRNFKQKIGGTTRYSAIGLNVRNYIGRYVSFSINRKVVKGKTDKLSVILYDITNNKSILPITLPAENIVKAKGILVPKDDVDIRILIYNGTAGNTLGIDVEYSKPYLCIGETLPDIYIPAKADLTKPTLYPLDGNYEEIKAS